MNNIHRIILNRIVARYTAAQFRISKPIGFAFFCALLCVGGARAAAPNVVAFNPIPNFPVGAAFAGSLSVNDPLGGNITKLRVHVSRTPGGSDCAIDVGSYSGTQSGSEKVFSGCAELATQPGQYYLSVEAWNTTSEQAPMPSSVVQVGPVAVPGATRQAAAVSAGYNTVCALDAVGAVACWGGFAGGDVENPVAVTGLGSAMSVSAGEDFACALEKTGVAKCWGANTFGQLGNSTTTPSATPVAVVGVPALAQITASKNFACGLTRSTTFGAGGAVYCWGLNNYGQLGGLSPAQSTVPLAVAGLQSGVGQIVTGLFHACALLNNGGVKCWGPGPNVDAVLQNFSGVAAPLAINLAGPVFSLGAGNNDTCGVTSSGSMICWGQDAGYILGAVVGGGCSLSASGVLVCTAGGSSIAVPMPTPLSSMSSGGAGHCAISRSGQPMCQGYNGLATVGNGQIDVQAGGTDHPVRKFEHVVGIRGGQVIQLARGNSNSCAVTSIGKLYCWGYQARHSIPSIHYLYSTTAYEVPAYRTATQALVAPTISSATVHGANATLTISDNLSAGSPVVTTLQTKCRAAGRTMAYGAISTVLAAGRNPVLRFALADAGPWSCSVRSLGAADEGVWGVETGAQSPWSAEFSVAKQPTAFPLINSAKYDGAMATIVFADNAPVADGPILSKSWYCMSQSSTPNLNYGTIYTSEPTGTTHTLQFAMPAANDWQCRVNYATYGGNSPSGGQVPSGGGDPVQFVPLSTLLPGSPAVTAGRVAGNTGILSFEDGQALGDTVTGAVWSCARARDGGVFSGAVTLAEATGSAHSISFPLTGSDYLQNPDSYACTVAVRKGVLTSPASATFNIGPNRPPAVNGLAASVVNGVIQGQFVISDPDGDSVKNVIVRFSDQPNGSLCSSGYLVPPETLVSTGARSFQVLTDSCSSLLASASTIYAWVEAYDQHGRQAAVNSVSFANVPTESLIPDPKTNSIVFSTIPNLKVDQAVDVSLRMVDGVGNTLTAFRGPVRITINESVSWSMSSDGSQTSAGFRYVAFRNGVGQIRALRFHGPGNITLHAASLVAGQQHSPPVNSQESKFAPLSAPASLTGGVPVSGKSNQVVVTSYIGSGTSNYQIKLNVAPISSSDCSDLTAGRVGIYLVDTATTTRYVAALVPPCSGGAKLSVFVPKGHYRVAVFRNNVELRGWRAELSVVDKGTTVFLNQHQGPAWSVAADGKKPIVLVHGVFGSTVAWTGWGADGPAPQMPPTHCNDNSTAPQHSDCTKLRLYSPAGAGRFTDFGWSDLRGKLESMGYYVVDSVYDWRLKPRDAAATLALRIKGAKEATKMNRVDVFAHSMGGLVALAYLEKMQNDGLLSDIDRLVMVGSPLAGSVNAFYLMALGDPVEADKRTNNFDEYALDPHKNTYSNLARQIFEDMEPPKFLYKRDDRGDTFTYNDGWTQDLRRQTLADQVPSGWALLPRTPSFANGSLPIDYLSSLAVAQTAIAGANPSLTNTECVARSVASSRSTIPAAGDKTRVFYLMGTSESTLQGLDSTNFNNPNPTTTRGDGTVPITLGAGGTYGQLAEFKKINNFSFEGGGSCTITGQFGPHPDMPGDSVVQSLALPMLTLPPSASPPAGTLVASKDQAPTTAAAALPSLGFSVRGPKVFALAGSFGTLGSDALGTVIDSAGSATYSQQLSSANALVSSPANGNYTMTLQPDQSIARVLVPITVSYSDGTNVASKRFAFLLGAGVQTLQFALASASASPITMVGRPVGVPKLSYTSVGGSGIVAWTAPADASITGYQVYARRAMDSEWVQLGSTTASARSLAISISPASNDNSEYELAVLGVNAQGEGPVGAVAANRVTGDVALDFGDAVVVAPSATAVSAEVIAGNSVAQPFTVQGGEFSINGGAWATGGGVLNPGDRIKVRGVAPTTPGTSQAVTITTNTGVFTFEVLALSRRLSVGNTWDGTGTVSGGVISCGSVCSADYANGASVTLTAAPAAGSIFSGWSGDCSGTGNCVLSMTAAKTVSATFGLAGPAVSLNPLSLTFASQTVGSSSAPQSVTLTNSGTTQLAISGITSNSSVFVLTHNCGATLAVSANCTANLVFKPNAAVDSFGAIQVASNAPGSPHSVTLSGVGTASTAGLVAHYCFDDAANLGKDCSTNANNGTPTGGVSAVAGKSGGAALFGGFNNPGVIRVPNSPTLQFGTSSSVSFFAKIDDRSGMDGNSPSVKSANGNFAVVAKRHDQQGAYWNLNINAANELWSGFGASSGGVVTTPGTEVLVGWAGGALGRWVHVVHVIDSVGFKTYLDGQLAWSKSGTVNFSVANTQDMYIGKYSDVWYPLNGALDELKIFNRALSVPEVQALYVNAMPSTYPLAVSKDGTGAGTVTSAPAGINCGATCSANFASAASVTLTAAPTAGSSFTGWSGACTGTGSCVVTMGAAKSVTATFTSTSGAPVVSLNPGTLTFANQSVGTTSTAKTVTLTNTGNAALTISSIASNNGVYGVTNNCAGSRAAGASCTLSVTYSPSAAVSTLSSISVNSNDAGSPHSVTVNGTGVPAGAPVCTLTANPASVVKNGTVVLSASCTNSPTSYTWTGGTCAGTTTANCTANPATTTTYGVSGTNSTGTGSASAQVTVNPFDITPILLLLLD